MKKTGSKISRRDLLKSAAVAGATLGLTELRAPATIAEELIGTSPDGSVIGMKFEPRPVVRVGIIGVGARGTSMVDEFLGVDGVQITSLCDTVGLARSYGDHRNEERKAHRSRSAGGNDAQGVLGACRYIGEDSPPLHHDGELLLRRQRDVGVEHGASRTVWRTVARRGRLHSR